MAGWVDGWIWKVPRYVFTFLKDYLPSVSSVSLIKELADKAERGFMNRLSVDDKTFTAVKKGLQKKIWDITTDEPRWMICCCNVSGL